MQFIELLHVFNNVPSFWYMKNDLHGPSGPEAELQAILRHGSDCHSGHKLQQQLSRDFVDGSLGNSWLQKDYGLL